MIIWNKGMGINTSTSVPVQEYKSLNDAIRNQLQNNLEMFPQSKDRGVRWNSLEKIMWVQNIYMGSGGDQEGTLE